MLVALGLSGGPVVAIGLARFAYSLLLPAMRDDLRWTLAQAGGLNTANAIGYLAGAVGAGPLLGRAGSRRPYLAGLAVVCVAVLASAATGSFPLLLALRLIAGAAGAIVFIAGATLVAHLVADLPPGRSTTALGTYIAGAGTGIVISAIVVPPIAGLGAGGSWRLGWVVLGAVSLLVTLLAAAPAALRSEEPPSAAGTGTRGWPVLPLLPTLVGYGLYGAGYIAYVTFIVAFLEAQGLSSGAVTAFWAVLGAAATVAAFAWGPILGRLRGGRGPTVVLAVTTLGALLPLVVRSPGADFASAVLFGGSFLAVVTAVTNVARRAVAPARVAAAIALLTVGFGIGQCVGPVLAGALSDGPRGVRTGIALSVLLLVAGAVVSLAQRAARPAL
ncbi:MAG: YbfB/YjiJ family MFS transporter [Candidatus Dormibacteraceae bacterium]